MNHNGVYINVILILVQSKKIKNKKNPDEIHIYICIYI